ncbi:MAG: hypothetical protein HEQ11_19055 [Gemmatimonas sp.]
MGERLNRSDDICDLLEFLDSHGPTKERLPDQSKREPQHLPAHVHRSLPNIAIEVTHQSLQHVLLHRKQLVEIGGLEALRQQPALPQPGLAMSVDHALALEFHHALDLDIGLLVIVPVAAQHVLENGWIGRHQ